MSNFQRVGSVSNAQVGRDFEAVARSYFATAENLKLTPDFSVNVSAGRKGKARRFDLGSEDPPVLVECKSHKWTESGNMPSAKVTVWNESMYYFLIAPRQYRKVLFVLRDTHKRQKESLAEYYARIYAHLIPRDVEIVEFDEQLGKGKVIIGVRPGAPGDGPRPAGSIRA